MSSRWTTDEVSLLRRNLPTKEIAKTLGRTVRAVNAKRQALKMSNYEGIFAPEFLSDEEKEARIYKLARQMSIKIQ